MDSVFLQTLVSGEKTLLGMKVSGKQNSILQKPMKKARSWAQKRHVRLHRFGFAGGAVFLTGQLPAEVIKPEIDNS